MGHTLGLMKERQNWVWCNPWPQGTWKLDFSQGSWENKCEREDMIESGFNMEREKNQCRRVGEHINFGFEEFQSINFVS